jgi:hypothetical protein
MAEQYDDTNRGAAFTPFPTQQMILQGRLNVEGADKKVMLVRDKTRDGKQIIEVYEKAGTLFDNDKKENGSAPDYSGPFGDSKRLAGWKKMKDGKPYMSFQVSDKMSGGAASSTTDPLQGDGIPF